MNCLKLIAEEHLSKEQKELIPFFSEESPTMPVFEIVREPTYLQDLLSDDNDEQLSQYCIWCDKHATTIIVSRNWFGQYKSMPEKRWMFDLNDGKRKAENFAIFGQAETNMAETITFFFSLMSSKPDQLTLYRELNIFRDDQLIHFLDANPNRLWEFRTQTWTIEQSILIATRPGPLQIKLFTPRIIPDGFFFSDDGTAFVDALEQRTTPFGFLHLHFEYRLPFSLDNYHRLLELEYKLHKLELYMGRPAGFCPFETHVHSLNYRIDDRWFEKEEMEEFGCLNIVAKELTLYVSIDCKDTWTDPVVAFLNRVAQLGHFEHLGLEIQKWHDEDNHHVKFIADAIIRVVQNNSNLKSLDFFTSYRLDSSSQLEPIFQAMESHKQLRIFRINIQKGSAVPYASLERLLSRNRNLEVLTRCGDRLTNGTTIDKVYALNQCYHGSAKLLKEESESLRSMLLGTALIESASANFPHIGLLLLDHVDVLLGLISNNDYIAGTKEFSATNALKRKLLVPTAAAKKVTREQ